jgi:phosphoadenosine phosphosulfate reductase
VTLKELTLWGERDKVQIAIERLRMFEPPEGYYLAFSGGKDSQTIYRLAELAGVKFTAHYNVTTVDPPELVRFIREQYPTVVWSRPKRTMWELIEAKGLPTRKWRFCCEHLKEVKSEGFVITGIRWEESPKRATRKMVEICQNDPSKTFVNPIIDWSANEVWAFLNDQGLPHCSLYDEGQERIGCILCPLANMRQRRHDAKRWPRYYALYERAAQKRVDWMRVHDKPCSWADGAEAMAWWFRDHAPEPAEQCSFLGIMEEPA